MSVISICLGTAAVLWLVVIYSLCRVAGDADRRAEEIAQRMRSK